MAQDTAKALGRAFFGSCTTLAAGLLEEESSVLGILGWKPRDLICGYGESKLLGVFKPWRGDSSVHSSPGELT